jgi:hypothetical protein
LNLGLISTVVVKTTHCKTVSFSFCKYRDKGNMSSVLSMSIIIPKPAIIITVIVS